MLSINVNASFAINGKYSLRSKNKKYRNSIFPNSNFCGFVLIRTAPSPSQIQIFSVLHVMVKVIVQVRVLVNPCLRGALTIFNTKSLRDETIQRHNIMTSVAPRSAENFVRVVTPVARPYKSKSGVILK